MTTHLTAAYDLHIALTTPNDMPLPPEFFLLAAAYIPHATLSPTPLTPNLTLTLAEAPTHSATLADTTCTVHGPWNNRFPDDAYHILHTLARTAWLKQNLYAAHMACIVINGKTILLAGPSGSGKSTIALTLLKRGAKVFSGNTTLLQVMPNQLLAHAGTTTLTLKADNPHLAHLTQLTPYGNRVAAYFPLPPQGPLTVDAIALVRLNDGVTEAHQLPPVSALHTLYPICMDATNADVILGPGAAVISPLVPPQARLSLANNLAKCLTHLPTWQLTGSLQHITQHLEEIA